MTAIAEGGTGGSERRPVVDSTLWGGVTPALNGKLGTRGGPGTSVIASAAGVAETGGNSPPMGPEGRGAAVRLRGRGVARTRAGSDLGFGTSEGASGELATPGTEAATPAPATPPDATGTDGGAPAADGVERGTSADDDGAGTIAGGAATAAEPAGDALEATAAGNGGVDARNPLAGAAFGARDGATPGSVTRGASDEGSDGGENCTAVAGVTVRCGRGGTTGTTAGSGEPEATSPRGDDEELGGVTGTSIADSSRDTAGNPGGASASASATETGAALALRSGESNAGSGGSS
jgi:hypothetical protein